MFDSQFNYAADVPGSVTFTTQITCDIITMTWDSLPDVPCPITAYMIDVDSTTLSAGAGATSFNYMLGDGFCGNTYQISVYGVSTSGTGSRAIRQQATTCAGKGTTVSVTVMQ